MVISARLRLCRAICDIFAIFVGCAALIGATAPLSGDSLGFWNGLMALSLACGAVAGIGTGFTESPRVRRWMGVPVFAMCAMQLTVQGRLFALGIHDQLALSMCGWSFVSATILLCWLADQRLRRHIQSSSGLRLKYRLARGFSGICGGFVLMTLVVGIYNVALYDDLPSRTLSLLYMAWHVSLLWIAAAVFWMLTCPRRAEPILVRSSLLVIVGVGIACNVLARAGFAMQDGQPTLLTAMSIVALAALVAGVLGRKELDSDNLAAFRLAAEVGNQQQAGAAAVR